MDIVDRKRFAARGVAIRRGVREQENRRPGFARLRHSEKLRRDKPADFQFDGLGNFGRGSLCDVVGIIYPECHSSSGFYDSSGEMLMARSARRRPATAGFAARLVTCGPRDGICARELPFSHWSLVVSI